MKFFIEFKNITEEFIPLIQAAENNIFELGYNFKSEFLENRKSIIWCFDNSVFDDNKMNIFLSPDDVNKEDIESALDIGEKSRMDDALSSYYTFNSKNNLLSYDSDILNNDDKEFNLIDELTAKIKELKQRNNENVNDINKTNLFDKIMDNLEQDIMNDNYEYEDDKKRTEILNNLYEMKIRFLNNKNSEDMLNEIIQNLLEYIEDPDFEEAVLNLLD